MIRYSYILLVSYLIFCLLVFMEHNIHNFLITLLVFMFTLDFVLCIQWIGLGNQELLDYFSTYDAVRARHSYGPQGHRGMSVLIFEAYLTNSVF